MPILNHSYKNQVTTIYHKQNASPKSPRLPLLLEIFPEQKMSGTLSRLLATGSNETKLLFPMYLFFGFLFMEMRHCTISDLFQNP
jgi:hypothetical protein